MFRAVLWSIWLTCLGAAIVGAFVYVGREPPRTDGTEYHARLLEIAETYKQFQPVDFSWSLPTCALPGELTLGKARLSASDDEETHGGKVYFLYVKHREFYLGELAPEQLESQVVVKESWTPEQVEKAPPLAEVQDKLHMQGLESWRVPSTWPYLTHKGKTYRAGEKAGLFIMFKVYPPKPNTDNGWVYGTVTADGQTVTSAGRVASCMGCHQKAKHDRLFGLDRTK